MKLRIENPTNSKVIANGFLHHNKTIQINPKTHTVVDSNLFLVDIENELSLKNVFKNLIISEEIEEITIPKITNDVEPKKVENRETNTEKLQSLSKRKLVEECKKAGLSDKGTVKELSDRLNKAELKVLEED